MSLTKSYVEVFASLTKSYVEVFASLTKSYVEVFASLTKSYVEVFASLTKSYVEVFESLTKSYVEVFASLLLFRMFPFAHSTRLTTALGINGRRSRDACRAVAGPTSVCRGIARSRSVSCSRKSSHNWAADSARNNVVISRKAAVATLPDDSWPVESSGHLQSRESRACRQTRRLR